MKPVQQIGRANIRAIKQGIEISIPARKSVGQIGFLAIWLAGWSIGGFVAIQGFFGGIVGGNWNWLLFAWLCGWFLGETAAVRRVINMLFGQEIIRIVQDQVKTGQYIFGIGNTHTYNIAAISNPRLAPAKSVSREKVWFTHESATRMCCREIDRVEAAILAEYLAGILAFRCHIVERIVFGDLRIKDDSSLLLQNPDVSSLTFPFVQLKQVIIDTETYTFGLVERFLTYAVNHIGQAYLRAHVELVVYGQTEKLHPNLLNNFRHLCKHIIVKE